MCIGAPGQILSLSAEHPHLATVAVEGKARDVNVGLLEVDGVKVGDWVLVHLGMAVSIMTPEEARESHQILAEWERLLAEGPAEAG